MDQSTHDCKIIEIWKWTQTNLSFFDFIFTLLTLISILFHSFCSFNNHRYIIITNIETKNTTQDPTPLANRCDNAHITIKTMLTFRLKALKSVRQALHLVTASSGTYMWDVTQGSNKTQFHEKWKKGESRQMLIYPVIFLLVGWLYKVPPVNNPFLFV